MNIQFVLQEYDNMFGIKTLEEIESFLVSKINEASQEKDAYSVVTLLNEMIGFCRDTTQKEKALQYCQQVLALMKCLGLEGSIEYATSLINVANAYRAFGVLQDSLLMYQEVEACYKKHLADTDFRFATLYNNMSLLYQEMNDFEGARDLLKQSLQVVDLYPEAEIAKANTRTNLAASMLKIYQEQKEQAVYEEAIAYLKEALEIYEKDGGVDFHYNAALSAMGDAKFFAGDYENAVSYYERSMEELEKHVGRTDNYERVREKWLAAKDKSQRKGCEERARDSLRCEGKLDAVENNLVRSRAFYEKYGKEMIHNLFSEYEDRIAVGLVGEGSDCFGYDDEISKDHDYGIGFCMWLTETDYKAIGKSLQREYEKLLENYQKSHSVRLSNRRGVFAVNDFYNGLLGTNYNFEECDSVSFMGLEEHALATVTNGEIYRDELGVFSKVRTFLKDYYPHEEWTYRIGVGLHNFSQFAQSNYSRMMARKDYVTASICVAKGMEAVMDLAYLLNRQYAPYYKWKKQGMESFSVLKEIPSILEKMTEYPLQKSAWEQVEYSSQTINKKDLNVSAFEEIAAHLLNELNRQHLTYGQDLFLESYCKALMGEKNMDLVEEVVKLEWEQFDKVKNEGGRADCQDDWNTFSVMRKSQYLEWEESLLVSYRNDLLTAKQNGWNLIMEKYARMMKSTTPEKYKELEQELPVLKDERIAIQEEIIKIQVQWMEEFARKYPKMAGNARSIHTAEDTPFNTSYETYLRGEMGTYSEETFMLYGRFIISLLQREENLAYNIMNNTAKLYGYESVEDAETRL